MDELAKFFDEWTAQREKDGALYPGIRAHVEGKDQHKAYAAFLSRFRAQWPVLRKPLFERLKPKRLELEKRIRAAAQELAAWWKREVTPNYCQRVEGHLAAVRDNPELLNLIMRNPNDGSGSVFHDESVQCFSEDDRGPELFAPGKPLRIGIEKWLEDCHAWFKQWGKRPLDQPAFVLRGRPSPAWGYSSTDVFCVEGNPTSELPLHGYFSTPKGPCPSEDRYWDSPTRPGSRKIYDVLLRDVLHNLYGSRPHSIEEATAAESANPWATAHTLDLFLEFLKSADSLKFTAWLDQLESEFDIWARDSLGDLLIPKQAPGSQFATYHRIPRLTTLLAEVYDAQRELEYGESPRNEQARPIAQLVAFLLDQVSRPVLNSSTTATPLDALPAPQLPAQTIDWRTAEPAHWTALYSRLLQELTKDPSVLKSELEVRVGVKPKFLSRNHGRVVYESACAYLKDGTCPSGGWYLPDSGRPEAIDTDLGPLERLIQQEE